MGDPDSLLSYIPRKLPGILKTRPAPPSHKQPAGLHSVQKEENSETHGKGNVVTMVL